MNCGLSLLCSGWVDQIELGSQVMIWSTRGSVTDIMALPVTSDHVSSTPCESCDLSLAVLSFELLYVQLVVRVLILNRCETSRFEPLNAAKRPIALPSRTTFNTIVFNQQK